MAKDKDALLRDLGAQNRRTILHSLQTIAEQNDPSFLPALEALKAKNLIMSPDEEPYVLLSEETEQARSLITNEVKSISGIDFRKPRINNSVRRKLTPLIAQLQLFSDAPNVRLHAAEILAQRLQNAKGDIIASALQREKDAKVKEALLFVSAQIHLNSDNTKDKLKAIKIISDVGGRRAKILLERLLEKDEDGEFVETDASVRKAAKSRLNSIDSFLFFINIISTLFRGISLGSILLLTSLGLAVTFGLMKVINMAHGEMLMIGAYATYMVQVFFQTYFPDWFGWYIIVAIPFAFLLTGLIGMVLERSIIRFLYGRPLETLLATWGISLLLIQTVRLIFGAQNVEVANPAWLSGGIELTRGWVLPYNRLAVIAFVILVVFLAWRLFQHSRYGLNVNAVVQNRSMASCLGVASSKIDMLTFGLGSSIAGLGGVALSQIGNVGPEMGQGYIVDSFMVVVLGGVGKISGTVISSLGLGIINKFLEPAIGAVFGKILILIFIILFIQKKPQGLFALKGRLAEES